MTLFAIIAGIAVLLTGSMFLAREPLLAFPSMLFWAIAGGQSYLTSTATWDIYFLLAFGCLLGMTTFTGFAGYAIREKRDSIGDVEMEQGEGGFIDEKQTNTEVKTESDNPRIRALHKRAADRRNRKSYRREKFDVG